MERDGMQVPAQETGEGEFGFDVGKGRGREVMTVALRLEGGGE